MTSTGTPSIIALWVLAILSWLWGALVVAGARSEGDLSGTLTEVITGSVLIGAGVLLAGLALATQALVAALRARSGSMAPSHR